MQHLFILFENYVITKQFRYPNNYLHFITTYHLIFCNPFTPNNIICKL